MRAFIESTSTTNDKEKRKDGFVVCSKVPSWWQRPEEEPATPNLAHVIDLFISRFSHHYLTSVSEYCAECGFAQAAPTARATISQYLFLSSTRVGQSVQSQFSFASHDFNISDWMPVGKTGLDWRLIDALGGGIPTRADGSA